ncbi:MAG TPA: winged helix DNA-binding domain-containing protein [Actinomycetes bacterium]|nr:winged helix DNA-binding domain-containing protein [Actinomycetes bacterium]
MNHISDEERRRRIGVRHRLAPGARASSLMETAASMVVLHATDPAGLFLEARARMTDSSPASISRELYDDRTVFRLWAMRRTLFLAAIDDVPVIFAAASRAVAEVERRRTLGMLADAGIGPEAARLLGELEAIGLEAIRGRGEAATAELRQLDPRLDRRITTSRGKSYEGTISVASKVAFHLALDGHIGRDRPRGTWISGQFRWSPVERWLPDGIRELPVDVARAELVRRWLLTFGPGTRDDIAWWTGWGVGPTRQALAAVGAVEVRLDDGQVGYVLPDDLEATPEPGPWVALLPVLDATTMGWKDRGWYLGPHRAALFDSAGNAGPTIWVEGRIVGGWTQRPSGEIAVRLLERIDTETAHMIDAEAARLAAWLGPTRIRWPFA